jgi:hypothetical protein
MSRLKDVGMEKTIKRILTIGLIVCIAVINANAQDLQGKLSGLKQLLSGVWSGELRSPDGSLVSIVTEKYEFLPGRNVIKFTKQNEGNDSWGEGYFYWDDLVKKIAFFSIEKNGVFCTGYVTVDSRIITIEGKMTWPTQVNPQVKQSYDFKNTLEFTSVGKMIDRWFMNAFGEWRSGHTIEFSVK